MGRPSQSSKRDAERNNAILVADDDATNRDVIRRQLERLGYECDIASDGARALDLWRAGGYGLLMTDLHMPDMDGFQLAAALRREEGSGRARTTIIAFTANSVHGELQKCLDAGMDDYLTKPLGMKELRAALDRWLGDRQRVSEEGSNRTPRGPEGFLREVKADKQTAGSEGNAVIDERALKSMFGDDPDTFKQILNEFLESARANIDQIRAGVEERSAAAVQAASHKLKSSARSVGAHRLADTAVVLEAAGRSGDWKVMHAEVPGLSRTMVDIEAFVKAL